MALSERSKLRFPELLNSPEFAESFQAEKEGRATDPYKYCSLNYWLQLDTWTELEGIYLLAGLDPKTVDRHLLETDISKFDDALPLDQQLSFQTDPTEVCDRKEFPGADESYQSYLEAFENKSATLGKYRRVVATLDHILSRSVNGLGAPALSDRFHSSYRPIQFLEWAKSIGYKVPWIDSPSINEILASNSKVTSETEKPLGVRERDNLLRIIGAMLELLGSPRPKSTSESEILEEMLANYDDMPGIKKRTLEEKFAMAKRALASK